MSDDILREEFRALRDDDRESAPSFRRFWLRAGSLAETHPGDNTSVARWVAIAASVIVAALLLFGAQREIGSLHHRSDVPSITAWSSPTAGLLQMARPSLLTPSMFSSVLDGVAPMTLSRDLE